MRKIVLEGSSDELGAIHGAELAGPITAYLNDRLELAGDPYWSGREAGEQTILEKASSTIVWHERFSEPLYAEMVSMATNAGITPAEAVVVGGFTDLIDVVRADGGPPLEEDDCTGVIDADAGLLAQTWDMHASAGEFVYMFDIRPNHGPRSLVQTTAGCLGQMGLNEAGIAVGINNLTAYGQPGVTWPFVVRAVLAQTDLDKAVELVLDARLAGGHNFFLVGPDGVGCNIEAMPKHKEVTRVETGSFVHTNHCLSVNGRTEEGQRSPLNEASSEERLTRGGKLATDLEAFFADDEINRGADKPHDVATCGAVVMDSKARSMRAVWGRPGEFPWEQFDFG